MKYRNGVAQLLEASVQMEAVSLFTQLLTMYHWHSDFCAIFIDLDQDRFDRFIACVLEVYPNHTVAAEWETTYLLSSDAELIVDAKMNLVLRDVRRARNLEKLKPKVSGALAQVLAAPGQNPDESVFVVKLVPNWCRLERNTP
jgi:hypothetical protein